MMPPSKRKLNIAHVPMDIRRKIADYCILLMIIGLGIMSSSLCFLWWGQNNYEFIGIVIIPLVVGGSIVGIGVLSAVILVTFTFISNVIN